MTIAWMAYVLLVGTLLALGARAMASALAEMGRPTRYVWAATLGGIVALAVIAPRQKAFELRADASVAHTWQAPLAAPPAGSGVAYRLELARNAIGAVALDVIRSVDRRVPRSAGRALLIAWAVASASLFFLFLLVNRRLAVARRAWPQRVLHHTAVRVAPSTGPAVLGLTRAEIVVPRSLLDRAADEQRVIVRHELEHLRARDHLMLGAAWLVPIALPWHPAVWYLVNRIRLAIELDCDARVLRGGIPARSYGALLIDVAAHRRGFRIGALALADGPSHLERRILAMKSSPSRHAAARGTLFSVLGAVLLLAACEAKIPTSAEIDAMDVASAERSASEAGYIRTPVNNSSDFFINGVKSSAEQARALAPKEIGSIEVVKSEYATGRDTIYVTTADRLPSDHGGMRMRGTFAPESAVTETRSASTQDQLSSDGSLPRFGEQPIFLIDGKKATARDFAALSERDIASMAVYKGKDALNLRDDGKNGLEVTSRPADKMGVKTEASVIEITTKLAKARANKQP